MRPYSLGLVLLVLTAGCNPDISYGLRKPAISGRVTIDGAPAPGVIVVATVGSQDYKVVTQSDGTYVFGEVPFGHVAVHAEAEFVVFPAAVSVELDAREAIVNLAGVGPVALSGAVVWEFAAHQFVGIAGVPVHLEAPFKLDGTQSALDGSFRFTHAPGSGSFPIVFGALPEGFSYRNGDRSTYRQFHDRVSRDTAFVRYQPSGELFVYVLVDGQQYSGVAVHLNTPLPITTTPGPLDNLPTRLLTVSISGFPSSISFDATEKQVQVGPDARESVTFIGYTAGANRPPSVTLIAPSNGATFTAGTPITFRGSAQDLEDGTLTGNALDWILYPGGTLGHGEAITIDTLRVGSYRLMLRADDSGGGSAFTVIDLNIVPATGGRVVGTVTSNGTPLIGARVDLLTTPARFVVTDQQGRYAFEDVPAGSHVLGVQPVSCVDFPVTSTGINVAVGVKTTVNFVGTATSYCYTGYGRPSGM